MHRDKYMNMNKLKKISAQSHIWRAVVLLSVWCSLCRGMIIPAAESYQEATQDSWRLENEKMNLKRSQDLRQCGTEFTVCGTVWTGQCCPGLVCDLIEGKI